jgi:hypothetical protein
MCVSERLMESFPVKQILREGTEEERWERLGVMGCNNVELSCAPRQIVLVSSWLVTA